MSPSLRGIQAVRAAHLSALQTTTMLNALGRPNDVAEASEFGIYRAVFSQAGRNEISMFVTHCVGNLLDYDSEHRRNLAATLSTYLELSQHHARTCATLHIHANTLYNRLGRIDSLIGSEWKESARSLDIQLALRLNRLMRIISPVPGTTNP
jgi:DNA-binding PucR family transcriptional regulator